MDFRYMQKRARAHLKTSYKEKEPTLATESWENKKAAINTTAVIKSHFSTIPSITLDVI